MSTHTHAPPGAYPAKVTDDLPKHVRDALDNLREAHERVTETEAAHRDALTARKQMLRDLWPLIGPLGPRPVGRLTGMGESTVRNYTRSLPAPWKDQD